MEEDPLKRLPSSVNINSPRRRSTLKTEPHTPNEKLRFELSQTSRIDLDKLLLVFEHGASPNDPNEEGKTALHILAGNRKVTLDLMKVVLDRQADPNIQDKLKQNGETFNNKTPLHHICSNSAVSIEIIQLLLQRGADVSIVDQKGDLCLHHLCTNRNITPNLLKLILEKTPDVNKLDVFEKTPLHYLCANPSVTPALISLFLNHNAQLQSVDNNGRTHLHYLCSNHAINKDLLALMEKHHMNPDIQDKDGNSCLHLAFANQSCLGMDCLGILLSHSKNLNTKNNEGRTVFHVACGNSHITMEVISTLLARAELSVLTTDNDEHTCLHLACKNAYIDISIIQRLVEEGSDLFRKGKDNKSAIELAYCFGFATEERLLIFYEFLLTRRINLHLPLSFVDGYPWVYAILNDFGVQFASKFMPSSDATYLLNFSLEVDRKDQNQFIKFFVDCGANLDIVNACFCGYTYLIDYLTSDLGHDYPSILAFPSKTIIYSKTPLKLACEHKVHGTQLFRLVESYLPLPSSVFASTEQISPHGELKWKRRGSLFYENGNNVIESVPTNQQLAGLIYFDTKAEQQRFTNIRLNMNVNDRRNMPIYFECIIATEGEFDIGFVDDMAPIPDFENVTTGSDIEILKYQYLYEESFRDFYASVKYNTPSQNLSNNNLNSHRKVVPHEHRVPRSWSINIKNKFRDVIGILILDEQIIFSSHGNIIKTIPFHSHENTTMITPAICLGPYQAILINFGQKPFLYSPLQMTQIRDGNWESVLGNKVDKKLAAHLLNMEKFSEDKIWVPFTATPYGKYDWTWVVSQDFPHITETVSRIITHYSSYAVQLANTTDEFGRKAIDVAVPKIKELIQNEIFFLGRYELKTGAFEHRSTTCVLVVATDWRSTGGEDLVDEDEEDDTGMKVALKFMKNSTEFGRELSAREGVDSKYLMPILRSYNSDEDPIFRIAISQKPELSAYKYMLVLPYSDRSLSAILLHEHICGSDWDKIKIIFRDIVLAISDVHDANRIHGDIKPLNIMRKMDGRMQLIDMDGSVRIGEPCGSKLSTGYMPPEMVTESDENDNSGVDSSREGGEEIHQKLTIRDTFDPLPAAFSYDLWSLGAILYNMCTGETLFQTNAEDNLVDNQSLEDLYTWTHDKKAAKINKIQNSYARNLVSQLLSKDPNRRPSISRILQHPFLTGKAIVRMVGEKAQYDVFLSYRFDSDFDHAELLYNFMVERGLKVWWDRKELRDGVNWEKGFCEGLVNSKVFVCLISRDAIFNPSKDWHNFEKLTEDSPCDNVLFEHRFALELMELGLLEAIFPVFIGEPVQGNQKIKTSLISQNSKSTSIEYNFDIRDLFPSNNLDVCVKAVEEKLIENMSDQALGSPMNQYRTIRSTITEIRSLQGAIIKGDAEEAFLKTANRVVRMCRVERNRAPTGTLTPRRKANDDVTSSNTSIDLYSQLEKLKIENQQFRLELEEMKDKNGDLEELNTRLLLENKLLQEENLSLKQALGLNQEESTGSSPSVSRMSLRSEDNTNSSQEMRVLSERNRRLKAENEKLAVRKRALQTHAKSIETENLNLISHHGQSIRAKEFEIDFLMKEVKRLQVQLQNNMRSGSEQKINSPFPPVHTNLQSLETTSRFLTADDLHRLGAVASLSRDQSPDAASTSMENSVHERSKSTTVMMSKLPQSSSNNNSRQVSPPDFAKPSQILRRPVSRSNR